MSDAQDQSPPAEQKDGQPAQPQGGKADEGKPSGEKSPDGKAQSGQPRDGDKPVDSAQPSKPMSRGRKIALLAFAVLLLAVAIAYGIYWLVVLRHQVSTDDAYVGGNLVMVSAQVEGTVISIGGDDTDQVEAGHALVALDPIDARMAAERARADLAAAVRAVRGMFADAERQEAQVAQAMIQVATAESDALRRAPRQGGDAVSEEEYTHARRAAEQAHAALASAMAALAALKSRIDGTTVETHPQVAQAAARMREALLAMERATVPAPVAGAIAKRSVQVGQHVTPGQPLMAIVPLDQLWVDANFKESQLRKVRLGQAVVLHADLYGGGTTYHGRVVGIGAGTGAAFALLPAQNASGNWIKIVQRLPVRIALDGDELRSRPLRVGLSMEVVVDISDQRGATSPPTRAAASAYRADARVALPQDIEARIHQIILDNLAIAPTEVRPITVY